AQRVLVELVLKRVPLVDELAGGEGGRHGTNANAWARPSGITKPVGRLGAMAENWSTAADSAARDAAFGPNAWLVDEMYERYRAAPSPVSETCRDFFVG